MTYFLDFLYKLALEKIPCYLSNFFIKNNLTKISNLIFSFLIKKTKIMKNVFFIKILFIKIIIYDFWEIKHNHKKKSYFYSERYPLINYE